MPDQKHSSAVDDILEALKQDQTTPDKSGLVEDILADLGVEQEKKAPSAGMTQSFWQEAEQPSRRQHSCSKGTQKETKSAPPAPKNEEPTAPRLSDTLQINSEFQKFFSESIAVVPDPEPEQHPGLFAWFVGRKKDTDNEEDEEFTDQDDYATALEEEPEDGDSEQDVPRRRFGFWRKRRNEEPEWEEEDNEPEPPAVPARPATEKTPRSQVRQQVRQNERPEPVRPAQKESGTVELPEMPQMERPVAPAQDNAPTREMEQPEQAVGGVEIPMEIPMEQPSSPSESDERTQVIQPQEEQVRQSNTGSIQLNVEWDEEPDTDATQAVNVPQDSGRPRLWGDESSGTAFEDEPEPEYIEDYENPADAPVVQQDLDRLGLATAIRAGISAALGIVLLYLGLAVGDSPLPAIGAVDPAVAPQAYLAVNLVLLAVVCGVNWRVFWNGLRGLWGAATADSVLALAGTGALVQLVVLLIGADSFEADKLTLFAAPAALLLCFGALGKYLMSGVIRRNFQLISAGSEHVAAFRLEDGELSTRLAEGLGEPDPCLVANRPTTLMEGFLRRSFSTRASDRMLQRMSWVLAGAAVLTALIALFTKQGLAMAFTAFAGTLCLGGPASATLLAAIPAMLMQKSAARVGAVVPGWSSIEELSGANMIVVGARDLFPSRSVRLHGIKTFEKERIDLAILYAASVLIAGCDTLRDVFMEIIQGKTGILFPVESLENDPGFGFTAWVKDKRVILGNRAMMEKQGVEIPSLDYENRYTKGKKLPVYLAVSGRLFGMFLVSYRADEQASHVLQALGRQGISVLVKSDDFSLTTQLIRQVYGLEEGSVKVLNGFERNALAAVTEYRKTSPGCMSHLGSFASFVGGLLAAVGAASAERVSSLVQAAGVLVSVVLALLLAFTGGMAVLALPALVLYQAAWTVLTLMIPMLKRYE